MAKWVRASKIAVASSWVMPGRRPLDSASLATRCETKLRRPTSRMAISWATFRVSSRDAIQLAEQLWVGGVDAVTSAHRRAQRFDGIFNRQSSDELPVSAALVEISGNRINEGELGTELLIHGRPTDPGCPGNLRQCEAMQAPLTDDVAERPRCSVGECGRLIGLAV